MDFRNVTIKCDAEKLNDLLDLLDVEYVEEIIISRTPQEFNHDYQTSIGLLDEDEELELDGIEIKLEDNDDFKLDDFEDDDDYDFIWDFEWDN